MAEPLQLPNRKESINGKPVFPQLQPKLDGLTVVRVVAYDAEELRRSARGGFRTDVEIRGWNQPFWETCKSVAAGLFGRQS
jgi:hypothetical protein